MIRCDGCNETIKSEYFRCRDCYDFDFCKACQAAAAKSIAGLAKGKTHTIDHRMRLATPGEPVNPEWFEAIADKGVEVVANVVFEGGHAMPEAGHKTYEYMKKFYAGQL